MSIEVKVPSVGESVTSGVVSAWHKKSGEFVNEGEPLFALETDKVSTDIVAEKSGVLETKVSEGQEVKIGEVVAVIDDSKQTGEKKAPEPKKAEKPQQKKKEESDRRKSESEPGKKGVEKGEKAVLQKDGPLSPAVRRIVEEERLEPEKIHGTGMAGRLTKADVLTAAQDRKPVGEADSFPGRQRRPLQRSANLRRVRRSLGEGGSSLRSQKDVAAAAQDCAAIGDGAAHRSDSHHIQRMRHERGAGIAPEQAR